MRSGVPGWVDSMMAGERFGPIGHPRYIEYANDIGRSGRHVLDIVNDLLDISKIEAGEMDLDFAAVGLNEAVSEAVALVQPQANGQRVIIRTALSHAARGIGCRLGHLHQFLITRQLARQQRIGKDLLELVETAAGLAPQLLQIDPVDACKLEKELHRQRPLVALDQVQVGR